MGNEQSGESSKDNYTGAEKQESEQSWRPLSPSQKKSKLNNQAVSANIGDISLDIIGEELTMNTPAQRNGLGQGDDEINRKMVKMPFQTPDTVMMSTESSVDSNGDDEESDDSMDQIRAIALATAKRRLKMPEAISSTNRVPGDSDSELSDEGAKIRAIAQQTAQRRLMMAEAMTGNASVPPTNNPDAVRLEGYTGPEALAKERSRMERIKAKAIESAGRELGSDVNRLRETVGVQHPTGEVQHQTSRNETSDGSFSHSGTESEDESSTSSISEDNGPTNFHDLQDPLQKRMASKLLKKINHDPWDEFKKFSDPDVCEFLQRYPETARVLYDFTHFSGYIFPLSMLCTLGASTQTIEQAYKAYKPAIDECDVWIGTPLHYACSYKAKSNVVNFLISKQPSMLQKTNQFGRTPLHTACLFKGSTKMVSILLQKYPRAAVIPERDGYTPLHLACENGANAEIVKMLADSNPETCLSKTNKGSTPLDLAYAHNASKAVVEVLLQTCMKMAEKDHELNEMVAKRSNSPSSVGDESNSLQEQQTKNHHVESSGDGARMGIVDPEDISDDGADIRAIARETANRRLRMADESRLSSSTSGQNGDTLVLQGYTGPDALAKQMSRMEKIKERAIRSAAKELGTDTGALANTLGVTPTERYSHDDDDDDVSDEGSETDSDFSSEEESSEQESSEEEVDIRAIAKQTEERRLRMAEAMNHGQFSEPAQGMLPTGAVRLEGYTGADALARETSRMEKIKAKAILTASKQLGTDSEALKKAIGIESPKKRDTTPQETSAKMDLADAIGISASFFDSKEDQIPRTNDRRDKNFFSNVLQRVSENAEKPNDPFQPGGKHAETQEKQGSPKMYSLADALGMQVSIDTIESTQSSIAPSNDAEQKPHMDTENSTTSMKQKSFMQAVMEKASAAGQNEGDSEESSTQYTEQSYPSYRPQANSLAMALGMKVDPSSNAPAIREKSGGGVVASGPQSRKSFMQAVLEKASAAGEDSSDLVESDSDDSSQEIFAPNVLPQPHSLADALNMRVNPTSTAPMIQSGKIDPNLPKSFSNFEESVTGSLVPKVGQEDTSVSEVTYVEGDYDEEFLVPSQLSVKQTLQGGTSMVPLGQRNLLATIMERVSSNHESDTGSSDVSTEEGGLQKSGVLPQPNSLADALNMRINPVSTAVPIMEMKTMLPPPAEPEDVDNSESQYDDENLNKEGPIAYASLAHLRDSKDNGVAYSSLCLERSTDTVELALDALMSEVENLKVQFLATTEDVTGIKENTGTIDSKLDFLTEQQNTFNQLHVEERTEAKDAQIDLDSRLGTCMDHISKLTDALASLESNMSSKIAQQNESIATEREEAAKLREADIAGYSEKLSHQAQISSKELTSLKEQFELLNSDFKLFKSNLEGKSGDAILEEKTAREAALLDQEQQFCKRIDTLEMQYLKGLSSVVEQVFESSRWIDFDGKLGQIKSEIQESRGLLDKEHRELEALKFTVNDHFTKLQQLDDSTISLLSDSTQRVETSEVLKNIQVRMKRERQRQKELMNRLKVRAQATSPTCSESTIPQKVEAELPTKNPGESFLENAHNVLVEAATTPVSEQDFGKEENSSETLTEEITHDDEDIEAFASGTGRNLSPVYHLNESHGEIQSQAAVQAKVDGCNVDFNKDQCDDQHEGKTSTIIHENKADEMPVQEIAVNFDSKHSSGQCFAKADRAETSSPPLMEHFNQAGQQSKGIGNPDVQIAKSSIVDLSVDVDLEPSTLGTPALSTASATQVKKSDSSQSQLPEVSVCDDDPVPHLQEDAQQLELEMHSIKNQVQEIMSTLAELRLHATNTVIDEGTADGHENRKLVRGTKDFVELAIALLGLFLLGSSIAHRLSQPSDASGALEGEASYKNELHTCKEMLHDELLRESLLRHKTTIAKQLLVSKQGTTTMSYDHDKADTAGPDVQIDNDHYAAAPVETPARSDSVQSTNGPNSTIVSYFDDDASLSRLDVSLPAEMEGVEPSDEYESASDDDTDIENAEDTLPAEMEGVEPSDGYDSLPEDADMENANDILLAETEAIEPSDGDDLSLNDTAIENVKDMEPSVPSMVSFMGEPAVEELGLPLLPPSFASIHQFTRPIKKNLGSQLRKVPWRKLAQDVQDAIENEVQSENWV